MLETKIFFVLFCALLCQGQRPTTPLPTVWHWYQVPNPQTQPAQCNRIGPSWLCDPNKILPYREANAIDALLNETVRGTACPCSVHCISDSRGFLPSVLVLPQFYTDNSTRHDKYRLLGEARRFIYTVYSRRWNFDNCQEFIVVLYSRAQDLVYTMTGRVARNIISDETVVEQSLKVKRYFEQGSSRNITMGLLSLLREYRKLLPSA